MRADVPEIGPGELQVHLERDEVVLVDVREPVELEICRLEQALTIPLGKLTERLHDLPKDRPLVIMCHHGQRSHAAAAFLIRCGFDAVNLRGGIHAWACDLDPTMSRY